MPPQAADEGAKNNLDHSVIEKTPGSEAAAAAWSADVAEAMRDGRRQRRCRDAVTAARCALASGDALSAARVRAHQHRPYPATCPTTMPRQASMTPSL